MPVLTKTVIHRTIISLAQNEWGNEVMQQTADAYAEKCRQFWPLLVEVHEHAGWFLTFVYGANLAGFDLRDGRVVGTANDGWAIPAEIDRFLQSPATLVRLDAIRR